MQKSSIFVESVVDMTQKDQSIKKFSFNFLFFTIEVFVLLLIGILLFHIYYSKVTKTRGFSECDHIHFANAPITPSDKLNDPNELHLIHAQKNGLKKPFTTTEDFYAKIDSLKRNSILVEVTENKFYQVKVLHHSVPYLIPEAVDMLNEIGFRFQKRLQEKKRHNYRFRLTSLTRTEETQNSLSHCNGNAAAHSAHLYGTTCDISYKNFYDTNTDSIESSMDPILAMTYVLVEMRKECKLLVVRERHQSCFHITVVVCKPISEKNNHHFWSKVE